MLQLMREGEEVSEKEKERWYCVHFDRQMHTRSAEYERNIKVTGGSNT
jgi:hypothetical protein